MTMNTNSIQKFWRVWVLRENKDKRKFVLKGEKMTKRALISVSDKAGIVEFAQELKQLGWDIISTGEQK